MIVTARSRSKALREVSTMLSSVRAGSCRRAPCWLSPWWPAFAADKAFQSKELDEAAIKLEAQIKADAGTVTKPRRAVAPRRRRAFDKKDFRNGMVVLGQLVATAPNDGAGWLRLARTVLQIRPRDDKERALLLDRASTAAYIAYQRTQNRNEEADSLAVLGRTLADRKEWRGALDTMRIALEIRESADLRGQYERLRGEHGFRHAGLFGGLRRRFRRARASSSPKNCPAGAPISRPLSPSTAWTSRRSSADDKQLCVEGLKHGERYAITLRAGLPSTVHETLTKSAQFTIFVRDRKPFVRFTGKAYVLPKTGQRGIPLLSVNTAAVAIEVYRVGDRNLIDTVLGSQFQRNLYRYEAKETGREPRHQSVERRARRRAEAQYRGDHRVSRRPRRSARSRPASTP